MERRSKAESLEAAVARKMLGLQAFGELKLPPTLLAAEEVDQPSQRLPKCPSQRQWAEPRECEPPATPHL